MRLVLILVLVALGPSASANDVSLPPLERVVLDNGLTLLLAEKRDVPLVAMSVLIRGGAVTDPADKHGVSDLFAELLRKGSGERSSAAFAEAVASVGGRISTSGGLESLTISADFMARDTELMVSLIADMLRRPTLSADEFASIKTRAINLLKATKGGNPGNLMSRYARAFLFADHAYGNPVSGSEESLQQIRHEDVLAYFRTQVGADRTVISVVGDFDAATVVSLIDAALGDWPAAAQELTPVAAPGAVAGSRVFLVDKPGATQSYFYIGNAGVSRDYPERPSLNLANAEFGGKFTSMLVTALRTESGLSYSAGSVLSRYAAGGTSFISSFTETGTTVEAIDVALATLDRLHAEGLDEARVRSAEQYIMGQFPPRFETAVQLADTFAALEAQGLELTYITDYGSALAAATPQSVAAAITDGFATRDGVIFVVIGDADAIRDGLKAYGTITEVSIDEPRFHPAPQ